MFYNIVRERIYEGAVSRLLFQLEAEDLVQKSTVSMQPYGADDGADIAFHTANGCMIFRGYFHVKPFGNVDKQFRIGNSADDTINCCLLYTSWRKLICIVQRGIRFMTKEQG